MVRPAGRATAEGTRRYVSRFTALLKAGHYRDLQGLAASSIGLGTYLGPDDSLTDRCYIEAITEAVRSGCNVLDSAINYRCQRSERCIGTALTDLIESGSLRRDEVIVATKGGFIPFDGSLPSDPDDYFRRTFVDTGIAAAEDVVAGCHVMTPSYIRNQLAKSLENLNLECVDIYYVHNPETQLSEVDRAEFLRRLRAVFECLEAEAAGGRLQFYGTATWDGYRNDASEPDHLSLADILGIAREVAGEKHRFRVVQLPYNLAMTEALVRPTQSIDGQPAPLLMVAGRLGVYTMSSASILQGKLASGLPPEISQRLDGLSTDAQRAIQFVRSSPGLGTALVGMKSRDHVRENMAVAAAPPVPGAEIRSLFRKAG
ncbi:MAG: aldo/keto reductase [Acidobacteria bacterium]|nr:MAG: aldo/keto reductase [Acidobacteriota bacterium]